MVATLGASRLTIEAPAFAPPIGGLLPNANVVEGADTRIAHGINYTTADCGHASAAPGWCLSAFEVTGPKISQGIEVIEGDPFAIYKGVECDLRDPAEYEPLARTALERGQAWAIEQGVQRLILNHADTVDLTPGAGAVSPMVAVATLEQYAAARYGGLPTFHVSRFGAVFLPLEIGSPMTTKQGSPVANGGGYGTTGPGGVVAGAGEFWLYVSGQVNIWLSAPIVNSATDLVTNKAGAIAERFVVPTVECFVGAIRVSTATSSPGSGGVGADEIAFDDDGVPYVTEGA